MDTLFTIGQVVWVLANGKATEVKIHRITINITEEETKTEYEVKYFEIVDGEEVDWQPEPGVPFPPAVFTEDTIGTTKEDLLGKL